MVKNGNSVEELPDAPKPVKPFIRWAGSKARVLHELLPLIPKGIGRYVEPFAGSACLFFASQPCSALLADSNRELMLTYEAIKETPLDVHAELCTFEHGRDAYYALRSENPEGLTKVHRAARFVFLNRYCFNGLYRTNAKGQFNVPYAPSKSGSLPAREHLISISATLQKAELLCADFRDTLSRCTKGDFVYLDPPYAIANKRIFRQYDATVFGLHDLDELVSRLSDLDRRGIRFSLSYAYTTATKETFAAWPRRRILVQRNISGFSRYRRRSAELLVSNCAPWS